MTFDCGPSGGQGGNPFSDDGLPFNIAQINVWSGSYIDAIQLTYGGGSRSPKHGGNGGSLTTYNIEAGEYITEVFGRYGSYVDLLYISTNLRTRQATLASTCPFKLPSRSW